MDVIEMVVLSINLSNVWPIREVLGIVLGPIFEAV